MGAAVAVAEAGLAGPEAAEVVGKASERARRDPEFARVLAALVDAPIGSGESYTRTSARVLNGARLHAAIDEFKAASLTTAAVQDLLGMGTPQAVHRLRSRGKLVGQAVGNATYFPAWQFAEGSLRPDLPRIIELLSEFTTDVLVHDRIMRLVHNELGGQSIADALDDPGHRETAWIILGGLGF